MSEYFIKHTFFRNIDVQRCQQFRITVKGSGISPTLLLQAIHFIRSGGYRRGVGDHNHTFALCGEVF